MIFKNKYIKNGFIAVFTLAILTSLFIAYRRGNYEYQNYNVELVCSYLEINKLAAIGGVEKQDLYASLLNEAGITTITLEEDTLESLINSGRITLLKGSEISNLQRVGVKVIISSDRVNDDNLYLIIGEQTLFERIRDFLKLDLGTKNVNEIGGNILQVSDDIDDLKAIGLGVSTGIAKELQDAGFKVVPRVKNSIRISKDLINAKFASLTEIYDINTILFEGDSTLGYPKLTKSTIDKVNDTNIYVAIPEFNKQFGLPELAAQIPYNVIRLHSIPDAEMLALSKDLAINRYVRAVKERGVRMLLLHPFFNYFEGQDVINFNIKYFHSINKELGQIGYKTTPIKNLPINQYSKANKVQILFLSLGVLILVLLLFNYFVPLTVFYLAVFTSFTIILFYIFSATGNIFLYNRLIALITVITTPTLALISQFPLKKKTFGLKQYPLQSFIFLLKTVSICLAGSMLVMGLLSDPEYLLGVKLFWGVKLSFLVPLILIAIYYFLPSEKFSSLYYLLRRLFLSPVKTGYLVALIFCFCFIFIYILRSGNYINFNIPFYEDWLRKTMESLLFIRPRTKEFLIGYPMLIFTFFFIDKTINRHWLWFFNILGSVALISVVNSFCHTYTPLSVTLYRIFLGLILGIIVGFFYIWIFRFVHNVIKKFL